MTDLKDRIKAAVSILAVDAKGHTLKEEAEDLLVSEVDDELMTILSTMADTAGMVAFVRAEREGADLIAASYESSTGTLLAGLAIGRRMGIEEGESFGRMTAGIDPMEEM